MQIVIISGRSGSGKSIALQALEDLGFYAIDNLPAMLLGSLAEELRDGQARKCIAVSIDARNLPHALQRFPTLLHELRDRGIECQVVYLTTDARILIERYSTTRRRHPLTRNNRMTLAEAIEQEEASLADIRDLADLVIDTSRLSVHELRGRIADQLADRGQETLTLTIESFGFKRGVPLDADIVFDARCLPNPYWDPSLRDATGRDENVIAFLESYPMVEEMRQDILAWVERWLPRYQASQRSYLTVAVGCTGGQHRSVYLAERLAHDLASQQSGVRLRHRELGIHLSRLPPEAALEQDDHDHEKES
ncbi:RNase adapter RapZ [Halomonas elongata]|uniref:RNase adapter RapZ n=1 Tax=Halomonas elongata (strain ATCC 33173 / DSM 2581 / NBRC 15536 / NCIMB 2198 / 1H9) TaxID=768066 RepID=E1V9H0_HALED|nr:RNase adapter RapZ [Halomonas elongata]MBW5798510.1 RNase adapter RapZ [Halomonas elongata]MDL4862198.1 RNase adapter RapZ [Halomonas elongata]RAW07168.1 RNase adapter RapZ [Halomonas elongata]WBF19048.1 RNase adapter RapZ [Halomonas elongata]WPU47907.1 RNase adapter RapZ [Halomonas elongata DSM 2581]